MAPRSGHVALAALRCAVRRKSQARARNCGSLVVLNPTPRCFIRSGTRSHGPPAIRTRPLIPGDVAVEKSCSSRDFTTGSYAREEPHPGAIYVKIHPRPRTLSESAQVLGILRRFGDVEMYRHLKVRQMFSKLSSSLCSRVVALAHWSSS